MQRAPLESPRAFGHRFLRRGEGRGVRRDQGSRPEADHTEGGGVDRFAPKTVSLRERKTASKAKEEIVQVSARISLSLYDRLDKLRTDSRSSIPQLLAIAIQVLEAMEGAGRLEASPTRHDREALGHGGFRRLLRLTFIMVRPPFFRSGRMATETLAAEVGMSPERKRRLALIGSIAGVAIATVFVAQVLNQTGRVLLHNASPSEPEGVYLRTSQSPAVGRLVTFMAPASASGYVDRHLSYLRRTPILKAIAAGQGSLVCTTSGRLVIDGRIVAPVSVTDRHGVFLPQWKGCRRLGAGEWFA